jgi:hypothetical protein
VFLFLRFSVVVAMCLAMMAARALAQSEPEPSANARIRFGPLALNPTLALTNAGGDTNVFNDPDELGPKRDFTATVAPAADLWLRLGRSWLTGAIKEDLVYYKTYASERSVNNSEKVGLMVPLNRLTLGVGVDHLSLRDRPDIEITARSQRFETGFNGSAEIRLFPKTFIGVRGDRRTVRFDSLATFDGVNLQDALGRTDTTGAVAVRYQWTPLTSFALDLSRRQDRFEVSPFRDSNSTQISGSVKFDPFGLIKGNASFGYRTFQPLSPGVSPYHGATAAVDLSYIVLPTTKLALQATRDVQYSYDINEPYYVLTGTSGSIAQQILGPLDMVGRTGMLRLAYSDSVGAIVAVSNRTDYVYTYGGGIGWRVGRDMRVGFNVDHANRTSPVDLLQYHGLRYGMSVTYGS